MAIISTNPTTMVLVFLAPFIPFLPCWAFCLVFSWGEADMSGFWPSVTACKDLLLTAKDWCTRKLPIGVCLSLLGVDVDPAIVSPLPGVDCHAPSSLLSLFLVGVERIGFLNFSTFFSLLFFLILSYSLALASWTCPGFIAGLLPGSAAPMVIIWTAVFLGMGDVAGAVSAGAGVFLGVMDGCWRIVIPQAWAGVGASSL